MRVELLCRVCVGVSLTSLLGLILPMQAMAQNRLDPSLFEVPAIESSWTDLTHGINSADDWATRREVLKQRYLELIRDDQKPARVPLDLRFEEQLEVDGSYVRHRISYQVEADERATAYLGIPLNASRDHSLPAIVALHGTYPQGIEQAAGLLPEETEKAYLDHLCRRGLVVIAPEHFVSGTRIPALGSYDTTAFHEKHPEWTSVGKFTYEHAIAIDVLETLEEVDRERIGAMGHSLGGQGAMFLAAYDERIKAAAGNCAAAFFRHNPDVLEWSRDHWYVYFKPIRAGLLVREMPAIDFHEIMALAAPRAFLDVSALNDGHRATQRQRVLMLMEVAEIWNVLEVPDRFAFYVHGKGHAVPRESRELIYSWLEEQLDAR